MLAAHLVQCSEYQNQYIDTEKHFLKCILDQPALFLNYFVNGSFCLDTSSRLSMKSLDSRVGPFDHLSEQKVENSINCLC